MTRYTIAVTYDYVDKYEVWADDPGHAREKYERGDAEYVDHAPPLRRRVAVKEAGAPDTTARVL